MDALQISNKLAIMRNFCSKRNKSRYMRTQVKKTYRKVWIFTNFGMEVLDNSHNTYWNCAYCEHDGD